MDMAAFFLLFLQNIKQVEQELNQNGSKTEGLDYVHSVFFTSYSKKRPLMKL